MVPNVNYCHRCRASKNPHAESWTYIGLGLQFFAKEPHGKHYFQTLNKNNYAIFLETINRA